MNQTLAMMTVACLASCGPDASTDAFRDGFPRVATLFLEVPGVASGAQPLTAAGGVRRDGLEGDPSTFHALTRSVTATVNGAVVDELSLVERITDGPPSRITATEAVWGPHTEPLAGNTWRFTVARRGPGEHAYALEGKGRSEPDADYRTILRGTHRSTGRALGSGTFLLDWSAAALLPEHGDAVGIGAFAYARPGRGDPVAVDADLSRVRDGAQLVDARYRFRQVPEHDGALEFQLERGGLGAVPAEQLTVRSRWHRSGAGRSDVRFGGPDLPAPATASECWDSSFRSRYFALSVQPAPAWGTEAACAFPTPEYAAP